VVEAGASVDQIKQAALADQKVQAAIAGKLVVKVIVVPKKLVNIVLR
jgi:leucyl-tRNA synthetase